MNEVDDLHGCLVLELRYKFTTDKSKVGDPGWKFRHNRLLTGLTRRSSSTEDLGAKILLLWTLCQTVQKFSLPDDLVPSEVVKR